MNIPLPLEWQEFVIIMAEDCHPNDKTVPTGWQSSDIRMANIWQKQI